MGSRLVMAVTGCAMLGLLVGCAGTKKGGGATDDDMGRLRKESVKLMDKGYFAAVATEVSMDLQTAIENATVAARAEISRMIELELSNFEKRAVGQATGGAPENAELIKTFKSATQTVSIQTLQGCVIIESPYVKDANGLYTAFVLVRLDKELFLKNMKNQVNAEEALKAKFEEKKIFEEADAEWEKYREARSKE
jgi:hypothetical protein